MKSYKHERAEGVAGIIRESPLAACGDLGKELGQLDADRSTTAILGGLSPILESLHEPRMEETMTDVPKPKSKPNRAVSMTPETYAMLQEIQQSYHPKVTIRGLVTAMIEDSYQNLREESTNAVSTS